ncbi:MAG: site-specific DNA-methyltransferase [Microthrixaceae bacterium]
MSDAVALPEQHRRPRRGPTATSNFGSGRREAHDASAFYGRFVPPVLSGDDTVAAPAAVDQLYCADARSMDAVADNSVALVVTSPPYFAGKAYEEALGTDGIPATYFEYLQLLADVFAECQRVLEPGGRIAVNVANLGRRPYRSLAGDVTQILTDLGLLLRGEVVWWKGRAAGGSCAWGSFQRPGNPVLRDVTERVVVAGKGRFDRAVNQAERQRRGLPHVATVSRDEFMEATTDLWELPPEQASRVGHPAPFPVALPQRLIDLYTYRDDLVLDPFMGVGSTAVAAVRTGRHFVGFDTDPAYLEVAKQRVASERLERLAAPPVPGVELLAGSTASLPGERAVDGALRQGRKLADVAAAMVGAAGFADVQAGWKPKGLGVELALSATDGRGRTWAFDLTGGLTASVGGLRRNDVLMRSLGVASVLHLSEHARPLVLLSTDLPAPHSPGGKALRSLTGPDRPVLAALDLTDPESAPELARLFAG